MFCTYHLSLGKLLHIRFIICGHFLIRYSNVFHNLFHCHLRKDISLCIHQKLLIFLGLIQLQATRRKEVQQ